MHQETGEYDQQRLEHKGGDAERFYLSLAGQQVRVGVEATGGMRRWKRALVGMSKKATATPKAKAL